MATDTKGYHFIVTASPEQDAKAAFAACGAHDNWRINAEACVFAATMRGQKVWAYRLMNGAQPTVYVTQQQAARFGLCHCGQPAEYVGFEGIRCGRHAKFGMSYLCSVVDCTSVSETGFSSHCKQHTTPAMREAREREQAMLRAQYGERVWG